MKIIEPKVEIITPINEKDVLKTIELAGRVCYKSENLIKEGSAEKFIKNIISRKHEAVLEHFNITVKFTCDRGVSHEIVRHRLASYCQESTRYCNYTNDKFGNSLQIIKPFFYKEKEDGAPDDITMAWLEGCAEAEAAYFNLVNDLGLTPEGARSVLPNSTKTEVMMTANIREWRHFLTLRTSSKAHPDMRIVATMLLEQFKEQLPTLFEDIVVE